MEEFPTTQENNFEKPKVKEGVDFVFEQNKELETIGTQEDYSQYLDTIFPESVMKDIVYHGTASKSMIEYFNFEKSNFANAIFFSKDRTFAESFAFDEVRDGLIQAQLLDIRNPFDFSNKDHIEMLRPIVLELVKENYESKNTGIRFRHDLPSVNIGTSVINNPTVEDFVDHYMWRLENGSWRIIETDRIVDFVSKTFDSIVVSEKGVSNIAVFDQNQIHVLGSSHDIDLFKKYTSNL